MQAACGWHQSMHACVQGRVWCFPRVHAASGGTHKLTRANFTRPGRSDRFTELNLFRIAVASFFPMGIAYLSTPSQPFSFAFLIPLTTSSANAMSMFAYSHRCIVA